MYTFYFALIVLASEVVVVAAFAIQYHSGHIRTYVLPFAVCLIIISLLFLPWLPRVMEYVSLVTQEGETSAVAGPISGRVLLALLQEVVLSSNSLAEMLWVATFLIIGLWPQPGNKKNDMSILGLSIMVFVPLQLLLVFQPRRPLYARHLLFLQPLVALLMANGLQRSLDFVIFQVRGGALRINLANRSRRLLAWSTAVLLGLCCLAPSSQALAKYYSGQKQNYRDAAGYIEQNLLPGDSVIVGIYDGYLLEYYFSSETIKNNLVRPQSLSDLEILVAPGRRIWYVYSYASRTGPEDDPDLFRWVSSNFTKEKEFDALKGYWRVHVYRYGLPSVEAVEGQTERLKNVLTQESPPQALRVELANSYLTLGHWAQAAEILHNMTVNETVKPVLAVQIYYALGDAYTRIANLPQAIESYKQALLLQPQNTLISRALLKVYKGYIEQVGIPKETGNNLLANGTFAEGQTDWQVYNPSGEDADYLVTETVVGSGEKSGLIVGKSAAYHGGWYQQVQTKKNMPYLFSFYLKTEDDSDLNGRILYWENYRNDQPDGHWIEGLPKNAEWTSKWTVFLAPQSDKGLVTFYPVLVTGRGKVWIKDVRLVDLMREELP